MAIDVDRIFTKLGTWGRWQFLQIILINLASVPGGFHLMAIVFLGYEPPFQCTLPSNGSGLVSSLNASLVPGECDIFDTATNETFACEYGHTYNYTGSTIVTEWDLVCDRVYMPSLAQTVFIGGQAVGATFFATLADKFGRRRILLIAEALYFLINLGIAFIPGVEMFIVLRFFSGAFQQGLVMTASVFGLELLPASRRTDLILVAGLGWGLSMATLSLIGFAFVHQTWRHMQLAMCLGSAVGILHFLYVAYHGHLDNTNGIDCFGNEGGDDRVDASGYDDDGVFNDESVRWLYVNKQTQKVHEILRKAARINKKDIQHLLDDIDVHRELVITELNAGQKIANTHISSIDLKDDHIDFPHDVKSSDGQGKIYELNVDDLAGTGEEGAVKPLDSEKAKALIETRNVGLTDSEYHTDTGIYPVFEVIRNSTLRKTTLIMPYIWIVNSLVYFGLALLSDALAGDRVLNFFLLVAVTEIPSSIAVYIAMKRYGRKVSMIFFHILTGVMLLAAVVINAYLGESGAIGVKVLTLIGKVGISSSFKQLFMYTPELYPTNLRSVGIGLASSTCRIGGMIAPFARLLMKTHPWLPGTLFGTASLTAAVLVLFLDETRDKQLPQTIHEMKAWKTPKTKANVNLNVGY